MFVQVTRATPAGSGALQSQESASWGVARRLEVKHLEEKLEKYQEKEETIGKIKKHDDI